MGLNMISTILAESVGLWVFAILFTGALILAVYILIVVLVVRDLPDVQYNSIGLVERLNQTPEERGRLTQARADALFSIYRARSLTRASAARKAEAHARRIYGDLEVDEFLRYGDRLRPYD